MWLSSISCNGELTLDYLNGPGVTKDLNKREGGGSDS